MTVANLKTYGGSFAKRPAEGVLNDLSRWIKDGWLTLDGKGRESVAAGEKDGVAAAMNGGEQAR